MPFPGEMQAARLMHTARGADRVRAFNCCLPEKPTAVQVPGLVQLTLFSVEIVTPEGFGIIEYGPHWPFDSVIPATCAAIIGEP